MFSRTTNGIRVEVASTYLPKKSTPSANQYLFGYQIRIINENPEPVQLLHRHWIITDGLGRIEEIKGPGVVGAQPRILPMEGFEYSSFCPLSTPFGSMRGSYKMMRDNGEIFEIAIPLFSLVQTEPMEQAPFEA